jgi:hypothetical protein
MKKFPMKNSIVALPENEYMLCADGKKVTAGFDSKGGDVDMFSFEDGVTFKEHEVLSYPCLYR